MRREAIPKTDLSIHLKTALVNHIQSNRLNYKNTFIASLRGSGFFMMQKIIILR